MWKIYLRHMIFFFCTVRTIFWVLGFVMFNRQETLRYVHLRKEQGKKYEIHKFISDLVKNQFFVNDY